ncbi:protease SohB [Pseudomaricurvus alkylphenolicus]|uniref:protease SohB n=1 Tax=Pseudomaricurvus alkylphenolicus TaxID=1306991 RepID=UPI001422BB43|nr:protease SohB [Pseudomaricurvus alkylphenolicus]NIB43883.1 protease SohB [Pseudomaricurvus alkylphenolicus]
MEFLAEYGMFLAKSVTLIVTIVIILGLLVAFGQRNKGSDKGHIEVTRLNDRFETDKEIMMDAVLEPEDRKELLKQEEKRQKQEKKDKKQRAKQASDDKQSERRKRVYVLDFHGDIRASAVDHLREEISGVLTLAESCDEVVVRLESGGGMVHSYGLASSQLDRIKKKGIPLTVCVDKVAASGGYMMACVADRILAAPFAIMGSIGVVAQLPNFHRLLKKHDIDFELLTAGEHKRTLTMFGENTDKDREKFVEDLEDTHDLFKAFVSEHRDVVDIQQVANGDVWFGRRALDKQLVDELMTSDEYIHQCAENADVYEVEFVLKKSIQEKLGFAAQGAADRLLLTWIERLRSARYFS